MSAYHLAKCTLHIVNLLIEVCVDFLFDQQIRRIAGQVQLCALGLDINLRIAAPLLVFRIDIGACVGSAHLRLTH